MNALRKLLHQQFDLKTRAFVASAKACWYHRDVNRLAKNITSIIWLKEEMAIIQQLSELNLTATIMEQFSDIVHEIGNQIQKWISEHMYLNSVLSQLNLHQVLEWSNLGIIDYEKTAQAILMNYKEIHILVRFTLCCNSYFYNRSSVQYALWLEVKEYLGNNVNTYFKELLTKTLHTTDMVNTTSVEIALLYLSNLCPNNTDNCVSFAHAQVLFRQYIENNRLSMMEPMLFMYYLTDKIPKESMDPVNFALMYDCVGEDKRQNLLSIHPVGMLYFCLQWPLNLVFNNIAEQTMPSFLKEDLDCVVECICMKAGTSERPKFHKLFHDFWALLSGDIRRFYVNSKIMFGYMSNLFESKAVQKCLLQLIVNPKDFHTICNALMFEGHLVFHLLMAENHCKAVKCLLISILGTEKLHKNFDCILEQLCKNYLEEYYGI